MWLTDHIIAFVMREYPEIYKIFSGSMAIESDGSICRVPTPEEKSHR